MNLDGYIQFNTNLFFISKKLSQWMKSSDETGVILKIFWGLVS